ncbi:hypothetical protein EPA93_34395 [Ktedonosporobacter rubrisoli]|uniref:Protein kinase domain-containing protein n=1 Tax=Ktedonosporobacter rubrisoli TaxID=2509675 RepID=A0A4P6K066_KTERU|nr:serine/threonine-protein kinase [Ktedonosporobacter rubrisoli]QBD80786.1 hypothetical protein EPA93_34395 [Ktedonosporobacter rubrisoli]
MAGRLSYDDAMRFAAIRLKIQDPELKQGKVETSKAQTALGTLERPWGIEGGFAVVYKFRTRSGSFRALRCFRVPMSPDMQFRYERLGPYFHMHLPAITTDFTYHASGILVKEAGQPDTVYPIIEMDWIEGDTLSDKIDALCRQRDKAGLKTLSQQWLALITCLHKAGVAHGDLAGQNVMVRHDGRLVLIDYDGVYIPAFAQLNSIVLGQPDYQHPQSAQRKFNEHMDAFSALVIYVVLLALSLAPDLWNAYTRRGNRGEALDSNLLFKEDDFKEPQRSKLFRDLELRADPQVQRFILALKQACQQPIDQVRFPFHLIDPDYEKREALDRLNAAISTDDDELIGKSWHPLLENYQPARQQRERAKLAQQRVQALARFRTALQTGKLAQIANQYDPILNGSKNVTPDEREAVRLARIFLEAYREQKQDDEALLESSAALHKLALSVPIAFTQGQQRSIELAQKRRQLRHDVRAALKGREIEALAACYAELAYLSQFLADEERQCIELAQDFVMACATNDDARIIELYETIRQAAQFASLRFTQQQRERIELARRHNEALALLQTALKSQRARTIAEAYIPLLRSSKGLAAEEHSFLAQVSSFVQAYDCDDDEGISKAFNALLQPSCSYLLQFTDAEFERISRAEQRYSRLQAFQAALASQNLQQIVEIYQQFAPTLRTMQAFTQEQREIVRLAQNFRRGYAEDNDKLLLAAFEEIASSVYQSRLRFTAEEEQRISMAQQYAEQLRIFAKALKSNEAEQIINSYESLAVHLRCQLSPAETAMVASARDYLTNYQHFQRSLQGGNEREIRQAYKRISNHALLKLQPDEQTYVRRLQQVQTLEEMLHNGQQEKALQMARKLEVQDLRALQPLQSDLNRALRRYIRGHELEQVQVYIQAAGGRRSLVVGWRWPKDEQIRDGLLIYSAFDYPPLIRYTADIQAAQFHHAIRRAHEPFYRAEIDIGNHALLYVRVCAAIREFWGDLSEAQGPFAPPRERRILVSTGIEQIAQLASSASSLNSRRKII